MAKERSKQTLNTPPRNAWESSLEESEGHDRFKAGEIEQEPGSGEDSSIDSTGDGGYSGDAVIEGHDESVAQSERPLDREIHGDPRTKMGEEYPNDSKLADERQGPIGREAREIDDDTDEDSEER